MSAKVVKIAALALSLSATLAQATVLTSYSCRSVSGQIAHIPSTFTIQNDSDRVHVSMSYENAQKQTVTIAGVREGAEYVPTYNVAAGADFVTPEMALFDNFVYANGANYLETQDDTNEETFFIAADRAVLTGASSGQVKVFYDRGFSDGHQVIANCALKQ